MVLGALRLAFPCVPPPVGVAFCPRAERGGMQATAFCEGFRVAATYRFEPHWLDL